MHRARVHGSGGGSACPYRGEAGSVVSRATLVMVMLVVGVEIVCGVHDDGLGVELARLALLSLPSPPWSSVDFCQGATRAIDSAWVCTFLVPVAVHTPKTRQLDSFKEGPIMKINTISLITVALIAGAAMAQPQVLPPAGGASASESFVIVPTLNQRMQRMQEQMRQIHATTDPVTRKRLMDEHMKSMEQAMPMMSGMVTGAGMGSSKGMVMGAGPDTGQRMMMMEMRMDLMQKMMEQMLQHEAAAEELQLWAGRQFDAEVVAAFHRVPREDWAELHRLSLMPKEEKFEVPQVVGTLLESRFEAVVG